MRPPCKIGLDVDRLNGDHQNAAADIQDIVQAVPETCWAPPPWPLTYMSTWLARVIAPSVPNGTTVLRLRMVAIILGGWISVRSPRIPGAGAIVHDPTADGEDPVSGSRHRKEGEPDHSVSIVTNARIPVVLRLPFPFDARRTWDW